MGLMPRPKDLGKLLSSTAGQPIYHAANDETPNPCGYRKVMGYFLPPWQRGLVWTQGQQIKLIESLWLGLNIGTYTFNRTRQMGHRLDNLLIDGQQRLHAMECYLRGDFKVFGYHWAELPKSDQRGFEMGRHFHCYITETEDEQYLKDYYNMTNFGGTAHKEAERA